MFDVTNSIAQVYGLRSRQHAEFFAADGLVRGHLSTLRLLSYHSILESRCMTKFPYIEEVAQLPKGYPYRQDTLELLGNLKITLEARTTIQPEDRDLIMQLSPLYLEKLQAAEQVGEVRHAQAQTVRLLSRRVGDVSTEILARVNVLPLEQLDDLLDAALDFANVSDLIAWLDLNE